MAAVLAPLVACSFTPTTPTERWQQQVEFTTALNSSVVVAHEQGLIDDDDLRVILPPLAAVNQHLDDAEARLPEGGAEFEQSLTLVLQLLAIVRQTLEPLEIQSQTDPTPPLPPLPPP
ncbi:MAG: hypothetical protein AAF797_17585 [Planctomycetota bacterium]